MVLKSSKSQLVFIEDYVILAHFHGHNKQIIIYCLRLKV